MRVLNAFSHGIIDYVLVVALALAPTLFQLDTVPALVAYVLAAVHLAVSLCTRYPLGILKRIRFSAHGVLELLVSILLVALPWLLGFDQDAVARSVFIGLGLLLFAIWVITDYGSHTHAAAKPPSP